MADVILKDASGTQHTYTGVSSVTLPKSGGGTAVFGTPALQTKAATPTNGVVAVTPSSGYDGLSQVNVEAVVAPNLIAANIKKNVRIKVGTNTDDDSVADVTGSYEPTLQNKTVSPKVGEAVTVQKDSGYDGLDTVTVAAIPSKQIVVALANSSLPSEMSITIEGQSYSAFGGVATYATKAITINTPAAGAALVIDGTLYQITGTSAAIVLFDNVLIYVSGSSPYRIDVASMADIGGKVPIEYIYRAWEAYQLCKTNIQAFSYASVLIIDDSDYIRIAFLPNIFTITSYNDRTGDATAIYCVVATYTKSSGQWHYTNYSGSSVSWAFNLNDAVFTDTEITYGGSTIFPVNKKLSTTPPTLHAPTISLSGSTLTITDSADNGDFTEEYKIYDGNTLLDTVSAAEGWTITLPYGGGWSSHIEYNGSYYPPEDTIESYSFVVPNNASITLYNNFGGSGTAYEIYLDGVLVDSGTAVELRYQMTVTSNLTIDIGSTTEITTS